jgi:hypothetical protein
MLGPHPHETLRFKLKLPILARCHTPVLKEVNQSFHMSAQDVQITHTMNSEVNN